MVKSFCFSQKGFIVFFKYFQRKKVIIEYTNKKSIGKESMIFT